MKALRRSVALLLLVPAAASAQRVERSPIAEWNTTKGARAWLERLALVDPEAGATCGSVSAAFLYAGIDFPAPDVAQEFANFASDSDELVSWVAKTRLARSRSDREALRGAMLNSSHACIRCEAIQQMWYDDTDTVGAWFKGADAKPLLDAWEEAKHDSEHLVRAYRKGEYARVQTRASDSSGYYLYFRHLNGRWSYFCRNGSWIW